MSAPARSKARLLALTLMVGLVGCFEAPEQATGNRECRDLDSYGGTIEFEGAHLELPTGALSQATRVCIELESALPSGYVMKTPHYRFEPLGVALNVPAKVTLTLPPGTVGGVGLYWSRSGAGGGFDRVGFAVDADRVSAPIALFGTAFAGVPEAEGACGPANCEGCCDANGQCQPGSNSVACGLDGESCRACPSDSSCSGGKCLSTHPFCGPASCNGCCVIAGGLATCHPGIEANACGEGGEVCDACGPGARCRPEAGGGGQCAAQVVDAGTGACGPQSCAGCCRPTDSGPICLVGTSDVNCGTAGERCEACVLPEVCEPGGLGSGGSCVGSPDAGAGCSAQNCLGCCASDGNGQRICLSGLSSNACGSGGALCDTCSGNETCAPNATGSGGKCFAGGCGPHNCNGCCAPASGGNTICLSGGSATNCGTDGAVCKTCPGGTLCKSGACTTP